MSLFRASVIVSILSLTISLISFANQMVIAHVCGAGRELDVYLIAISWPSFFMGSMSGLLSSLLVPSLVGRPEDAEDKSLTSSLFWLIAGFVTTVAVIASLLTPWLLDRFFPLLPGGFRREAVFVAWIGWLSFALSSICGYLSALHYSSKSYFVPTLVTALPSIFSIAFLILLYSKLGVLTLALGLAVGSAVSIPLLFRGVKRRISFAIPSATSFKGGVQIVAQAPLVLGSMLVFTLPSVIESFWTQDLGAASLSYLGYTQRLLIAVTGVMVLGPITVLLPNLSQDVMGRQLEQYYRRIELSIKLLLVLGGFAGLVFGVFRVSIIELLFQRGRFDARAVAEMATLFPSMFFGMIAMALGNIVFRALYARKSFGGAALLGIGGAASYFVFAGLLSRAFQVVGISAGYALTWWALFFVSLFLLFRGELFRVYNFGNLKFVLRLLFSLAIAVVVAMRVRDSLVFPLVQVGFVEAAIRLGSAVVGIAAIYFFLLAVVLRVPEVRYLFESIGKRLRLPVGARQSSEG